MAELSSAYNNSSMKLSDKAARGSCQMTQTVENERTREPQRREPEGRPFASEHGHTGEGAASVLEYLISQGDKRKQGGESPEAR
jgi:hypothetical protein